MWQWEAGPPRAARGRGQQPLAPLLLLVVLAVVAGWPGAANMAAAAAAASPAQSLRQFLTLGASGGVWGFNGSVVLLEAASWGSTVQLTRDVELRGPGTLVVGTSSSPFNFLASSAVVRLSGLNVVCRGGGGGAAAVPGSGALPGVGVAASWELSNLTLLASHGTLASSNFWSLPAVAAPAPAPASASVWAEAATGAPASLPLGSNAAAAASTTAFRVMSLTAGGTSLYNIVLLIAHNSTSRSGGGGGGTSGGSATGPGCYATGALAYDSGSLHAALADNATTAVYVHSSFLLSPVHFTYRRPLLVAAGRSLLVYSCGDAAGSAAAPTLDLNSNWTRQALQVGLGGSLELRGIAFSNAASLNRLFWPPNLPALLSLLEVHAGGSALLSAVSITTPAAVNVTRYLARFSSWPLAALRPSLSWAAAEPGPGSSTHIVRWRLDGRLWVSSPGIPPLLAAATRWGLEDVLVVSRAGPQDCVSSSGTVGIRVDSGLRLRQLLADPAVPALQVGEVCVCAREGLGGPGV